MIDDNDDGATVGGDFCDDDGVVSLLGDCGPYITRPVESVTKLTEDVSTFPVVTPEAEPWDGIVVLLRVLIKDWDDAVQMPPASLISEVEKGTC